MIDPTDDTHERFPPRATKHEQHLAGGQWH